MAKRIVSDSTVRRIIQDIAGMTKRQAISQIIVTEKVKEQSATRYVRYAKYYYIQVMVKEEYPGAREIPTPKWGLPLPRIPRIGRRRKPAEEPEPEEAPPPEHPFIERRKRKRAALWYTHTFEFHCKVSEIVLAHRFHYRSMQEEFDTNEVLAAHDEHWPTHTAQQFWYVESLRPFWR